MLLIYSNANRHYLRHCVIIYARAGFPSCCDYRLHLVVRAIPLTLKLFEFLRCDAPVSSTLAEPLKVVTTFLSKTKLIYLNKRSCIYTEFSSMAANRNHVSNLLSLRT